jgi:tRNA 5-methylaminomethyl-2-thiouridine biosynthesis bifunctional protein
MTNQTPSRPYSARFDEHYWAPGHGLQEKQGVFIAGVGFAELTQKAAKNSGMVVAELGFGTGLNCALAAHTFIGHAQHGTPLVFYSFEAYPLPVRELEAIHAAWPAELAALLAPVRAAWPTLTEGWNSILLSPSITLHLWYGEALEGLKTQPFTADCWWLDGFSPSKNPALWAPELMREVAAHSQKGTRIATYSVARVVRDTLQAVGFIVKRVEGIPPKRHRLEGIFGG